MKLFRFALNVSSDLTVSVTSVLNLLSTPRFTCRSGSDVTPTQVNPNYFRRFARWVTRQVNTDIDVVVTAFRLVKCSSSRRLPFEQCQLVITNTQLELNPTTHQSNADSLQVFNVLKSPHVQTQGCWTELVNLLNRCSITNHAPDCLADMVGFQPRSLTHWFINFVVKLNRVPAVLALCNLVYLITCISKPLQSAVYFGTQLYRDLKFAFYRYILHLSELLTHHSIAQNDGTLKHPVSFFLPGLKPLGFQAPARFL
ncbi:hypothetical protein NIES4075_24320 [Tolypothrix sp. NIES-4075]|nr:hypothetical protein NIES4075_24320 [Tolypothrix sp. NIES-4075]